MIERFELGKTYRWIGPKESPEDFNYEGLMDFVLTGKPITVSRTDIEHPMRAGFEEGENPYTKNGCWSFLGYEYSFEEVLS